MADEPNAAAQAAAAEKDKKGGTNLVPVLAASVVSGLIMLGGLAYLMTAQNKALKETVEAAAKAHAGPAEAPGAGAESAKDGNDSAFYDLDEFLVNLNNAGGGRYLRTTISLRFHNESLRDDIKRDQPKVRDIIIGILTSHSTQDLATMEGKEKLKEEMITQLNKVIPAAKFDGVYLQSFTVQ